MRTLSSHYADAEGSSYSEWQLRTSRRTAPIVADLFRKHVRSGDRVLDFGCGGGGVIADLDCRARSGVEPILASRHTAISKGIRCEDSLTKFEDDSIDVVISNHALEHCRHPLLELEQMKRVLTSEGRLVLVVPSEEWRAQPRDVPMDHNHHLYTWTPLTLGNLLREAGYVVRSMHVHRSAWPPGIYYLTWLPRPVFRLLCGFWSRLTHCQEIVAVAEPVRVREVTS